MVQPKEELPVRISLEAQKLESEGLLGESQEWLVVKESAWSTIAIKVLTRGR